MLLSINFLLIISSSNVHNSFFSHLKLINDLLLYDFLKLSYLCFIFILFILFSLGEFTDDNPVMPTLCRCGENRALFHYPCVIQWKEKYDWCPSCKETLYYQEVGVDEDDNDS